MKLIVTTLFSILTMNVFAQMPNSLSPSEKVYGLSLFWQEANYNFVYLNKVDREKWDDSYKSLITEVQETADDYEYYRLLQKFCAQLKDGHTNVYFSPEVQSNVYNTYFGDYRLFLRNIGGQAIVARTNLSKKDELPVGTEVTKVNGLPTWEYIDQNVVPYISSSTDYIVDDIAVERLFQAPKGTSFDVEFKLPDGSMKSLTLTHTETLEKEVYPPFENRELFDFKWLEDGMAYVALNSFGEPEIDSLFEEKLAELYKAKSLIIDLRNNGGGSTDIGYKILQYLTPDDELSGSSQKSRLHIPAFKAWGKWAEEKDTVGNEFWTQAYFSYRDEYYHEFPHEPYEIEIGDQRIVVPTALLIGHSTASAAEDFLIAADKQKHMVKIGQPSYGSTGQPMMLELPGGGNARICTKKDTYPDGREFVGVGVQPDISVKFTLDDFLADKDPVLEKAIQYLREKK